MSSTLIPELKKKKDKLDLQEEPYFLKNGFVADASFLTNYQKINKFIRDHQENTNPDVSPNQKYKPNELSTVSQPKFTKPHPFETHLTNKNVCDVHANSKHFFPIYKDIQFTDFGELNKEKSNSNNFIIQKNWPNLQNKQYELQGFTGPEYTPEKNPYSEKNLYQAKSLYPSAIMKNETFTDFIKTEQKFKETQSTRLKQHIENLGGIEDTISSIFFYNILIYLFCFN